MANAFKKLAMSRLRRLLCRLEQANENRGDLPITHRPLFIIGPPRSGSTLVYQSLVYGYDVGYPSNLHHLFFDVPASLERLLKVSRWSRQAVFASKYGYVEGLRAPSEFGKYFYRFFRMKPRYVTLQDVDPVKMCALRNSLGALSDAFGRPFVVKNLPCSLRLRPLMKYVPEALYLVMRRDLGSVSRSLLAGRKAVHGDYASWWSIEPPNVEELRGRPIHEQVVGQVRGIESEINAARAEDKQRFMDISYEAFCRDTRAVLEEVAKFLRQHGPGIRQRRETPASFEICPGPRIDPVLNEALEKCVGQTVAR